MNHCYFELKWYNKVYSHFFGRALTLYSIPTEKHSILLKGDFMKGIILAAGKGTRMGAITMGIGSTGVGISKPLAPTFDKPTIYYALSTLIAAGIKEILIIAAPGNVDQFRTTLGGDGSELGITLSYAVQEVPRGIAEAFLIGADFIGDDDVALIFGDNIFNGHRFSQILRESTSPNGATIFALHSDKPQDFGVVEFNRSGKAISLEEKPAQPKSNYIVPGIYFYNSDVVEIARNVKPSARGELEITSVNEAYLKQDRLNVTVLDRDTDWFDTGNPDQTRDAGDFVRADQHRTGRLLGSPEAEAFLAGFITEDQLRVHAERLIKSDYGRALMRLANGEWSN